jgi:plasmid replication initiation protein
MQARFVYVAMAQIRPDDYDFLTVEMSVGDIVKALGLSDAGSNYDQVRAVKKGAMSRVLELDTGNGELSFNWFSWVNYIKSRDVLQVCFNDQLKPYILELKKQFQIHTITDLSKLQGRYSMGLYLVAMSYKGMAGTGGNKPGEWYVDLQFDYLRQHFKIGDNQYKVKADLRIRVIDNPIREINEAGIGIRIDCDYDKWRRGRRLDGVRLICRLIKPDEPRPVHPATASEKDAQALRAKYPDEWRRFYEADESQPNLPFLNADTRERLREERADEQLAAAHACELKKAKKSAKKTG